MFGRNKKSKVSELEFELDAADEELERSRRVNATLTSQVDAHLGRINSLKVTVNDLNSELNATKERLTTALRGNGDLQKALTDATRRQDAAVKHEQAALDDWSRLTVWILDHAPADIIQNSKGSTVDLALALLTRWMPVEDDKIIDADVVDDTKNYVNPDVKNKK